MATLSERSWPSVFSLSSVEIIFKTNILIGRVGESRNYSSVCPILILVEDIYSAVCFRRSLSLDLIQKRKVKDYGFPTFTGVRGGDYEF